MTLLPDTSRGRVECRQSMCCFVINRQRSSELSDDQALGTGYGMHPPCPPIWCTLGCTTNCISSDALKSRCPHSSAPRPFRDFPFTLRMRPNLSRSLLFDPPSKAYHGSQFGERRFVASPGGAVAEPLPIAKWPKMIIFLTADDHRYTIKGIIKSPSRSAEVKVRGYSWLFPRQRVPTATYFFTDIERLAHHELSCAADIYAQMRQAGLRVYNNPARVRGRAALLHHLNAHGINSFASYAADASPRPSRFPVFIKNDNHHRNQFGTLIDDQMALDAELEKIESSGIPLKHLLVTEFCAKPLRDGIFQKHSEFRLGDQYVPYDSILEANWCAKTGDNRLMTPDERQEAVRIMRENPFSECVAPAFEVARIEYGRIDFGFVFLAPPGDRRGPPGPRPAGPAALRPRAPLADVPPLANPPRRAWG